MGNSGSSNNNDATPSNNYAVTPYNKYASSLQLPPTSSGFLGRGREAKRYVKVFVNEITPVTLGREIVRRCGNEAHHRYLDDTHQTTLQFLRAAISFIPDAKDDGGDMRNAAFILLQLQREFVVQAGKGDWEFFFAQNQYGQIYGRNIRKPLICYMWDKGKSLVCRVVSFVISAIGAGAAKLALL